MTGAERPAASQRRQVGGWPSLRTWMPQLVMGLLLFAMVVVFQSQSPHFVTVDNLFEAARLACPLGLVSLGMLAVILTGGIDLSVGAVLALVSISIGMLFSAGVGIWPAILLGLAIGMGCGAVNGLLITRIGLPPIVVTLATLAFSRGVATGASGARSFPIPSDVAFLGQGSFGPVPVPLIVVAVVAVTLAFVLNRTGFGRSVYALGNNELASRFAGINVDRVKLSLYILSGFLSALAAVVYSSMVSSAKSDFGTGYELNALTAVVLGGTLLTGGRGGVGGTLLALAIIGAVHNGMDILTVSADVQLVIVGLILITTVVLYQTVGVSGSRGRLPASGGAVPKSDPQTGEEEVTS